MRAGRDHDLVVRHVGDRIDDAFLRSLRRAFELHPDPDVGREALARLRASPSLAASAVEEMLRYDGPSGAMVRVATEDVPIDGVTVKRGERLFLMINAANRDPRQFEDADRFDVAREPNRHVAFGAGIHFCVGAPLARLEAQIAVPALLAALPHLALAADALEWLDSLVFRGVRSLPLTF